MCIVPWDKTPVQRRGLPACNMQAETRAVDLLYSPSCAIPTSLRQQRPRSYCLKCLVVQVLLAVTRAALGHKLQIVAKSNHTPSSKGWILESSSPQSALQPIKWAVCSQALWRPGRKACCEFSCVAHASLPTTVPSHEWGKCSQQELPLSVLQGLENRHFKNGHRFFNHSSRDLILGII